MKSILLANPKGGCGKTTLAVNLASYYARRGLRVGLVDLDDQGSAMTWLAQRSPHHPEIEGWHATNGGRAAFGTPDVVVMDGPARIKSRKLEQAVEKAHVILVPVLPSLFDAEAVTPFLQSLGQIAAVRKGSKRLGLVANRTRSNTVSSQDLQKVLRKAEAKVVGTLSDSQIYVRAGTLGLGVFDVAKSQSQHLRDEWRSLVRFVNKG
ncbi:MAG: ParA family protein [bacterium]|nr:ParA family protein [bacterium]